MNELMARIVWVVVIFIAIVFVFKDSKPPDRRM